jgi:hypothetical protein
MQKKTRSFLIIGAGTVVVLLMGIGLGRLIFGGNSSSPDLPEPTFVIATSTSDGTASESANSSAKSAPAPAPAADPLASCESSTKAEAASKGVGYDDSTILVSFDTSVSYDDAVGILDSFGLAPHNSPSLKEQFDANHWLTVDVKKGDEFKEVCVVRGAEGVKYAGPNYTFKLAE